MESLYEKVLSFIRTNGPSLPIQIAKVIEKDTFYAGAILSDLLAKKAIKITAAKIGGSPLYYLPDQQAQLSKLYDHLPLREKEAYSLIQEKKVLKDTELQPAIRVACQMLRDFAIPMEIDGTKYWRWHLSTEEETQQYIIPPQPIIKERPRQKQEQLILQQPMQPTKQKIPTHDEFASAIQTFFSHNKISLMETISQRKNKEIILAAKVPSAVGDLDMLVIAKNKKKITANDLALANQKGQARRMPIIFLTTGEVGKKVEQHMEKNLKGYLILRKI